MKVNYYELNIGVNDKDTAASLCVDKVKRQLEEAFIRDSIDFSLTTQKGGYVSDDGSYVLEDSIKLIFIGNYNDEKLEHFINKVKEIYNQESILYIRKEIDQEFVGD